MKTSADFALLAESPAIRIRFATGCLLCICLPLAIQSAASAEDTEIVAVASTVSEGYVRPKLPDGSFQPENYTFGEGGHWSSSKRDATIDKMKFLDVAKVIALPLADQKYLPGRDPKQVKVLIMVYWGTTTGAAGAASSVAYKNLSSANDSLQNARESANVLRITAGGAGGPSGGSSWGTAKMSPFGPNVPQDGLIALVNEQVAQAAFDSAMTVTSMANRQRDRDNWRNARILGYDAELGATTNLEFTALHSRREDLIDEIEDSRYFVVLMAYDFQLMLKEKKQKLLWETRYSIRERGNDFSEQLAAMTKYASRYFGQDSHGLLRKPLPEGRVTLGKMEVGEVVPDKK